MRNLTASETTVLQNKILDLLARTSKGSLPVSDVREELGSFVHGFNAGEFLNLVEKLGFTLEVATRGHRVSL